MFTVAVRHLDKIYQGHTHILKDLNLDIGSGEFLVLARPLRLRQIHAAQLHCRAFGR